MTMVVDDGFSVKTPEEVASDPLFLSESQKPDALWVERLKDLPVGAAFTVNRQADTENVRQMKKRINKAAMVHWKTLDWKTSETNLAAGKEPIRWTVKIKALDTKKKSEAEAKLRQNGTQEAQQTPTPEPTPTPTPETVEEPSGPRARR
jgi:hypothetical protein